MKISAGILVYRKNKNIEVFLVHPGGPFWKNKDLNSWSIPKGEVDKTQINTEFDKHSSSLFSLNSGKQFGLNSGNILLETALREFKEETGVDLNKDRDKIFYLGKVRSPSKILHVFVLEKDLGDIKVKSNLIEIEYLGRKVKIPEVDKGEYFDINIAKEKLVNYQKEIINLFLKRIVYLNNANITIT